MVLSCKMERKREENNPAYQVHFHKYHNVALHSGQQAQPLHVY